MLVSKNIYERIRNYLIAELEKIILQGTGDIKPTGIVGSPGGNMDMEILKDKKLKLFEETDRQSEEQEAYIQELRHRLSLAEKVCFEANGYLKNKDNPLGRIYLDRMNGAVGNWDNRRKNKGAQYVVTED